MTTTTQKIPATLIYGDGIGPEITEAVLKVIDAVGDPFLWEEHLAGMSALESLGDPLPEDTLESIGRTRLALKAPLTTPVGGGFRSINVRLRDHFKLFANVRPAVSYLDDGRYQDLDLVLIRENLEGMYVGYEHFVPVGDDPKAVAESSSFNTRDGCRRIAEFAFDYAVRHNRKKITIVHKANILKALTGLFLETALQVAVEYRDRIEVEDRIVDNCAMQLVIKPEQFDVILTTNMFGDILSDEIAGLVGGLGLAPAANKGSGVAIFEAVHGSAPDIAGKGVANPTSLLLSAAMMLDHVAHHEEAGRIRKSVRHVLNVERIRTRDLGGEATTEEYTRALIANL